MIRFPRHFVVAYSACLRSSGSMRHIAGGDASAPSSLSPSPPSVAMTEAMAKRKSKREKALEKKKRRMGERESQNPLNTLHGDDARGAGTGGDDDGDNGVNASMVKLRCVGPYTVPWTVKRRWVRHLKQHSLFLQWIAFLAKRHVGASASSTSHSFSDAGASGDKSCELLKGKDVSTLQRKQNRSEEEGEEKSSLKSEGKSEGHSTSSAKLMGGTKPIFPQRVASPMTYPDGFSPFDFDAVCHRIVNEWGVPFMEDEALAVERNTSSSSASSKSSDGGDVHIPPSSSSSSSSFVGTFVHGPCHVTPFKHIDEVEKKKERVSVSDGAYRAPAEAVEGQMLVTLLSHLPSRTASLHTVASLSSLSSSALASVTPSAVYGTRQLSNLESLLNSSAAEKVGALRGVNPLPWLPDQSLFPSLQHQMREYSFSHAASQWYTPSFCAALTKAIEADRVKHAGQGYGPQLPAGKAMTDLANQMHCGDAEEGRAGTVAADDEADTNDASTSRSLSSSTFSSSFALQQKLRVIASYSAILPSRPLRQELENFPQEHSLGETVFEVVRAWEAGGSCIEPSSSSSSSSFSPHTASSHWRPSIVVDVGGGNGCMPWVVGHRFGLGGVGGGGEIHNRPLSTPCDGPTVVNIERYVTANNVGFEGGGAIMHKEGSAAAAATSASSAGDAANIDTKSVPTAIEEIPHTNCFIDQLGHGEMPEEEGADGEVGGGGETQSALPTKCDCCDGNSSAVPITATHRWCSYGPHRFSPRELPYYRLVHKDIREVDWRGDVEGRGVGLAVSCASSPPSYSSMRRRSANGDDCLVITKHLCGAGVDHLLRSFEHQSFYPKYLFINSCCHMKSSYREYINRPYLNKVMGIYNNEVFKAVTGRTSWLRQWGDKARTDAKVATLADSLQWQHNTGKCIEGLMDLGRVLWLRERGYSAHMVEHVPSSVTPRNRLLIARRHDGLLTV